MGIYPACLGVTTLSRLLSLLHQIGSPPLQPGPALEILTFPCLHLGESKRLTEENQAFSPTGTR